MSSIMDHILGSVLNLDSRTKFGIISHFGITDIYELLIIEPRVDLLDEYYIAPNGPAEGYFYKINTMTMRKIEVLQSWFGYQSSIGNDNPDWLTLDLDTFRQYSLTLTTDRVIKVEEPEPDDHPSWDPIPPNRELESFQRSIKRSPNDYNKFKDDSRWKQWHRHLKATANSHGLNDLLNPKFVPSPGDPTELFQCQQKFMYSVFEQCLLTTKSKHIVQLHEHTWDAQKVYAGEWKCMKKIYLPPWLPLTFVLKSPYSVLMTNGRKGLKPSSKYGYLRF